jgi:hypothetical protein
MKKATSLLLLMFLHTIGLWGQVPGPNLNEGFEDGVIPDNWTVINADGGTQAWQESIVNPHTGTYCASVSYESASLNNDDWLITPPLWITSATTDQISFWMRTYSFVDFDDWQVLISTTNTNPASFTVIDGGNGFLGQYVKKTYSLDAYGDAIVYLAVRYRGTNDWYLYVDDFEGPPVMVPSCQKPTNLYAANLTSTSADLGWTPGGTESAWNVEWGAAGFELGTGNFIENLAITQYQLTGLNLQTGYSFYVQANCGTKELSEWSGPFTFSTTCVAFELPFEQDFTGIDVGTLPDCWEVIGLGQTNWGVQNTAYAGGISPEMRLFYNPNFTGLTKLVSPPINTAGKTSLLIDFKHYFDYYDAQYTIGLMTTGDGVTWHTLWSVVNPTSNIGPEVKSLEVTAAEGVGSPNFRFAFFGFGNTNNIDYWHIDDVNVFVPLPPAPPINPNPISGATMVPLQPVFTWTNGTYATQAKIRIERIQSPFNTLVYETAFFEGNSFDLASVSKTLDAKANYQWRVTCKNRFGETVGPWWSFQSIGRGTIAGTVTDALSSAPLQGVTITVEGLSYQTETGANGQYSITNVLEGSYMVTASIIDYSTQSQQVTVTNGQTTTANFSLNLLSPPTGQIAVNPVSLSETHAPAPDLTTKNIIVTNVGDGILDFNIEAQFPAKARASGLCVTGVFTDGCDYGNGITSYSLANVSVPNIPCTGNPIWYKDYTNLVHNFMPGETYELMVTSGYGEDHFSMWIDFNNDLVLTANELIKSGSLANPNVPYYFPVTIPANATNGTFVMRILTNWNLIPYSPCGQYFWGNVVDFTAQIGGTPWLTFEPSTGTLNPGESMTVAVTFNSEGLDFGTYNANLLFTGNNPNITQPEVVVPVVLEANEFAPFGILAVNPVSLSETHAPAPDLTTKNIIVTNDGDGILDFNIEAQFPDKARASGLCVTGVFTDGCADGDGITSYSLANVSVPNIPCTGDPIWYKDYTNLVHNFMPGETYQLTATTGYGDDHFSMWIDFNNDLVLTANELIKSGSLTAPNVPFTFPVTIPADAPNGTFTMRILTNYHLIPYSPCGQYFWGNVVDFTAQIGGSPWLTFEPALGTLDPGESMAVAVTFNSEGLDFGTYNANLLFTGNNPNITQPEVVVPVVLEAKEFAPYGQIAINPVSLSETHAPAPDLTTKNIIVTNDGDAILDFNIEAQFPDKARASGLCVTGVFTDGCDYGDGITSYSLANVSVPNIPCTGNPIWYKDYTNLVHNFMPGETYELMVTSGYGEDYFSMWIDFNNDLELTPDELINSGSLIAPNVPYYFPVTIPANATNGTFVMRILTNWNLIPYSPCGQYFWGNVVDFTAQIGVTPWLTFEPSTGTLNPGESMTVAVTFNSEGLDFGTYNANLLFTGNNPNITQPEVVMPVELIVASPAQEIALPLGWSGWSAFIDPALDASFADVIAPVTDNMIISQYFNNLFYPAYGINTMGDFSNAHGYVSKMNAESVLSLTGIMANPTINLTAGWNLLPVISSCNLSSADVFGQISGLVIAFEVAGNGIYYPAQQIFNLETVVPGKAYWVKVAANTSFTFPSCAPGAKASLIAPLRHANTTLWNDAAYTGISHIVVFNENATAGLQSGDVLGAFTSNGICAGMTVFMGKTASLALFGDDIASAANDGFIENEQLSFRIYRQTDHTEYKLDVTYDINAPNYNGLFASNGLSVVDDLAMTATGIASHEISDLTIYPNPSTGIFKVCVDNPTMEINYMIIDTKGQTITRGTLTNSQVIDLTKQPRGVYFVRFFGDNLNITPKKLIIK